MNIQSTQGGTQALRILYWRTENDASIADGILSADAMYACKTLYLADIDAISRCVQLDVLVPTTTDFGRNVHRGPHCPAMAARGHTQVVQSYISATREDKSVTRSCNWSNNCLNTSAWLDIDALVDLRAHKFSAHERTEQIIVPRATLRTNHRRMGTM